MTLIKVRRSFLVFGSSEPKLFPEFVNFFAHLCCFGLTATIEAGTSPRVSICPWVLPCSAISGNSD